MEDQEHDRKVLAGELVEDTRFLCPERPCPMPASCKWNGRTCTVCGKKTGEHRVTAKLTDIAMAMKGGMPMGQDDLSFAEWQALGMIRAKMEPRL